MRKLYLALGVGCEVITFLVGLTFAAVGLNLVDVHAFLEDFQRNLDSLFYRGGLVVIGIAVMLVSLRIVFLLFGALKGRREVTLLKNETGDVKATVGSLETMLKFHLANVEGARSLKRVHIAEKKGVMRLFVTLVPMAGVGLEQVKGHVTQAVDDFCQKYQPISFSSVNIDLDFEEGA